MAAQQVQEQAWPPYSTAALLVMEKTREKSNMYTLAQSSELCFFSLHLLGLLYCVPNEPMCSNNRAA
jgi:hypothetical protein